MLIPDKQHRFAKSPGSPSMKRGAASSAASPHVNLISMRVSHHAGASGYDRLSDYIANSEVLGAPAKRSLTQRVMARAARPWIRGAGLQWYHAPNFLSELHAARRWVRQREGQVFHFLYGENSYRYLGALKRYAPGNALVATYHTPRVRFDEVVRQRHHLEHLDACIVVSNVQRELFSELLGEERVHYVPHGVDVDYFAPPPRQSAGPGGVMRCLFVGSHLRDVDTLAAAAKRMRHCDRARFVVVSAPRNAALFADLPNVEFRSGVSDAELLGLYHSSDVFVLPLLDCTANNGLLEAMACGLPLISTDLPGVRDYVSERCAVLLPLGDADGLTYAVQGLARDEVGRRRMAYASRARAVELSWERVAAAVRGVYDQALQRAGR